MGRYEVVEGEHAVDAKPRWGVRDTRHDLIVANFSTREEAESHAERLEQGPFDLDEQDAWEKDDDWGTWEKWED